MAEEKKGKRTKKASDEEKAAPQGEASPEEKPVEEAVGEAEESAGDTTAGEDAQKAEEEPEAPVEEETAESEDKQRELKKPLEKMTAKELREVASGISGITGVHAMKKEELLVAIRKAWGITEEKAPKKEKKGKAAVRVADLKARIQEFKVKRAEAIQKKDKRMAGIYRRRISRLKKRTRRAA